MSSRKKPQVTVKQEPGVNVVLKSTPESNSPGRLSSFKLPRDLTLGGQGSRKVPKKVYTPNLNTVRVKKQDTPAVQDAPRGRGRGRGSRTHNERGRGRGRHNSNLIQSDGVFSEGSAAAFRRGSSSHSSSAAKDDAASFMQKPTINLKTEVKVDHDEEKDALKMLLRGFDNADDDCKIISKEDVPTVLPIADWKRIFSLKTEKEENLETKPVQIKQEPFDDDLDPIVKTEPMDYTDFSVDDNVPDYGISPVVKVKQEFSEMIPQNSVVDFLSKGQSSIFLLQLPDTLPGLETATERRTGKENEEELKSTTDNTNPGYCTLRELNEGRIGKIVMYRSGKAKLILGETAFDLGIGTQSTFLQEVMSVNVNTTQRSGDMVNLGPVEAKLIASPDWNELTHKQT